MMISLELIKEIHKKLCKEYNIPYHHIEHDFVVVRGLVTYDNRLSLQSKILLIVF